MPDEAEAARQNRRVKSRTTSLALSDIVIAWMHWESEPCTQLNIVHKGSEGEILRSFFDAPMPGSSHVELLPVPGLFSCPDVKIQTIGQRKNVGSGLHYGSQSIYGR